jgi:hypothetical protein
LRKKTLLPKKSEDCSTEDVKVLLPFACNNNHDNDITGEETGGGVPVRVSFDAVKLVTLEFFELYFVFLSLPLRVYVCLFAERLLL